METVIKPIKITKENFSYFGDLISSENIKPIDINAGYAAGTFVVTVPYGYQYGESIISKKVDLAISNLLDLSPVVN